MYGYSKMTLGKYYLNCLFLGVFSGCTWMFNIECSYDPDVKYARTKRLCIGKSIDRKTMYAVAFEKGGF